MKYLIAAIALAPGLAFAAGSSSSTNPPPKTETTIVCEDGMVYAEETKLCIVAEDGQKSGALSEEDLKAAVREFAYAGQYNDAKTVLGLLDQDDDFTLTYMGFTARKTGDFDGGMVYYDAALTKNPNNLLARSYMGQALVEAGDIDGAKAQLVEINARGGKQTWPALSLKNAIQSGAGYAY